MRSDIPTAIRSHSHLARTAPRGRDPRHEAHFIAFAHISLMRIAMHVIEIRRRRGTFRGGRLSVAHPYPGVFWSGQ